MSIYTNRINLVEATEEVAPPPQPTPQQQPSREAQARGLRLAARGGLAIVAVWMFWGGLSLMKIAQIGITLPLIFTQLSILAMALVATYLAMALVAWRNGRFR